MSGASSLDVPFPVLLYSVAVFIVIPLCAGVVLRYWFIGVLRLQPHTALVRSE